MAPAAAGRVLRWSGDFALKIDIFQSKAATALGIRVGKPAVGICSWQFFRKGGFPPGWSAPIS
jgi:hypothetical protein